jgi:hypothetical protein
LLGIDVRHQLARRHVERHGDALDVPDIELYATLTPPPDYSLATEVDGIVRTVDQAGFERFHLASAIRAARQRASRSPSATWSDL